MLPPALRPFAEELKQLSPAARRALFEALSDNRTWLSEPSGTWVSPVAAGPEALPPRYEDRGLLGVGGVGEVRRVWDRELSRDVALKALRPELLDATWVVERFVAEARLQARLQHPGVVPIHDIGKLASGRWYFTMDVVGGRSLAEIIRDVHDASADGLWEASREGWTLRRLVVALQRVAEAVGHAHGLGVLHRDVKPENVLVGEHGEVWALDWGLARVIGAPDPDAPDSAALPVPGGQATLEGQVAGTPAFMSPEQAHGRPLDPRSDVYALGSVLYTVLAGREPYRAEDPLAILALVREIAPPPLAEVATLPIPVELASLCAAAMSRDPAGRPVDGGAFAAAIRAWVDGEQSRERALGFVAAARSRDALADRLREEAATLRAAGEAHLAKVKPWEAESRKAGAWARLDEAEDLDREAAVAAEQAEGLLHASLAYAPDLPAAHAALAARHRADHAAAEARRDSSAAARAELRLRTAAMALPASDSVRAAHLRYLDGGGALSLQTDPPGAQVWLDAYHVHNRRLKAAPLRALGPTPLVDVPLPMGRYRLRVTAPGRAEVRVPVAIGRGERWGDRGPDGAAAPVWLPPPLDLSADEVYVPAGPFRFGGDPGAMGAVAERRPWVDGFAIQRFPVTNRSYLRFLDDLVSRGRAEDAVRYAPRTRGATADDPGSAIYGQREDGTFFLRPDAEGDVWDPDWPVMMVDWPSARACAAWLAERTGLPWRLPTEGRPLRRVVVQRPRQPGRRRARPPAGGPLPPRREPLRRARHGGERERVDRQPLAARGPGDRGRSRRGPAA